MTLQKNGVKKMTAREMFEELGFEQVANNYDEIVYISKASPTVTITFDRCYRSYIVDCNDLTTFVIPREHLAITLQLEELGWL